MSCFVAFHYRSYGTFFLHKNRLHNIYRGFTHYKYYRAELFKNPDYRCHYFAKHKKSESDLDFAEFVFQNRENSDELQHHFDFIYSVQTDANPIQPKL